MSFWFSRFALNFKWCGTGLIRVLAYLNTSSLIFEDISVAVVGAGPVGLLAALALARRGYRKARKLADGEILSSISDDGWTHAQLCLYNRVGKRSISCCNSTILNLDTINIIQVFWRFKWDGFSSSSRSHQVRVLDRLPEPPGPEEQVWGDPDRSYNLGLGG